MKTSENSSQSGTRFSINRLNSARAIGKPIVFTLSLISCALALVSCASKQPQFTDDSFTADSRYQRNFTVSQTTACDAARRALLGDGYNIDSAANKKVKGRKAYQSEGDRSTFVEMNIVCDTAPTGSTLFANGVLSTYDVKKTGGAASVGLSALGSVSLPIGQSADSMVKTADQTVTDREFYKRFFSAVEAVLADIEPGSKTSETSKAKPISGTHQPAPTPHESAPATTPAPSAPEAKDTAVTAKPAAEKTATTESK